MARYVIAMKSCFVLAMLALGCGAASPPIAAPSCTSPRWLRLPFRLDFAPGSAELEAEQRPRIDEVITAIERRDDVGRVRVEGFLDECSSEREMTLSHDRAVVVAEGLVERGIARERIETVGYGLGRHEGDVPCPRGAGPSHNRYVGFSLMLCELGDPREP
jgi:outer membrane protein OmpA-like peptidoglycan-associated protein